MESLLYAYAHLDSHDLNGSQCFTVYRSSLPIRGGGNVEAQAPGIQDLHEASEGGLLFELLIPLFTREALRLFTHNGHVDSQVYRGLWSKVTDDLLGIMLARGGLQRVDKCLHLAFRRVWRLGGALLHPCRVRRYRN